MIRQIWPISPYAQVSRKVSLTISPFKIENSVMTVELVSQNLSYFQKIAYPRNTKPKKKGITPSKNINKLADDFESVLVIMLKLWLYWRYLRILIQASITPNPIKSSLCQNILKLIEMDSSRMATKPPKNWRKLPAAVTMNQKSKNLALSKKPSSSQFLWMLNDPFFDISFSFISVLDFVDLSPSHNKAQTRNYNN